jgi:hypothetical protein
MYTLIFIISRFWKDQSSTSTSGSIIRPVGNKIYEVLSTEFSPVQSNDAAHRIKL